MIDELRPRHYERHDSVGVRLEDLTSLSRKSHGQQIL